MLIHGDSFKIVPTIKAESVLDPFMGVGTTCFVSECLGRKTIGIEIMDKYFTQAKRRLEGETPNGQLSLMTPGQIGGKL